MRKKISGLNQAMPFFMQRNTLTLLHPTQIILLIVLILLTACTTKNAELEKNLTERLWQLKNSRALSIDLNDALDKNWRKFCVQGAYDIKENFNKDSGEQVNSLLDIS
ncbi:MAG: hypothetical protein RL637_569, partial [Pseudomonadota bacterium]